MRWIPALGLVALVAFVPLVAAGGPTVVQEEPYELSTTTDVDVPDRTVELDGSSYRISAVGEVAPGSDLEANVTVDGDADWNLDLYNEDEDVHDSDDGTGSGTATFPTSEFEPGTYALALTVDGQIRAVHPVVVAAHAPSLSVPANAPGDEPVTVTVALDGDPGDGQRVVAGLHSGDDVVEANATPAGDGSYEATLEPPETGEYTAWAVVRADEEAAGYPVSTGIAGGKTVVVGDGAGTATDSTTDSGGASTGDAGEPDTGNGSGTGTESDGNDSDAPLEPSEPTNGTDDGGSGDDALALSPLVVFVALALGLAVTARRKR